MQRGTNPNELYLRWNPDNWDFNDWLVTFPSPLGVFACRKARELPTLMHFPAELTTQQSGLIMEKITTIYTMSSTLLTLNSAKTN